MKAAVFYGKENIKIEEVKVKILGKEEVEIHIAYCGVCGTDIHIFHGDAGAAEVQPPTILGHEFSGIVTKVGEKVTKVKVGDRVCVDPNNMCGACDACQEGKAHFCSNVVGYGTTTDGGFAEKVVVAEKQVYLISDNLSLEEAAMTETVSCCIHGIDLCDIRLGSTALVIGGGPIGLLMIQLAKQAGAAKVILSEPVLEKQTLGLQLGADITIDSSKMDLKAELQKRGITVDTVIECVGNTQTIQQGIDCAARGATIMMFGLTVPDAKLEILPFQVFQKELHITASYINPYTFKRALHMLESGNLKVKNIITDKVALEDIVEVFTDERYRKKGKILIQI